ncbi:MAG: methylamine dehydrogenase light chain [Pseudomonadota bacterium]
MNNRQDLLEQLYRDLDAVTTGALRFFADRTSRRSFLGRAGAVLTGMGAFPLLPMAREGGAAATVQGVGESLAQNVMPDDDEPALREMGDDQSCEYWRYCAFSGSLCSCCGGSLTQCPPGAETASVAWVGTCHNPMDGQDYLVSYNDCCGKSGCGRCGCHRSEGDRPVYFPSKSNSILWCFGSKSHAYHCTLARVVGKADTAATG